MQGHPHHTLLLPRIIRPSIYFILKTKILRKATHVHCRKFEIHRKAKSRKYNLKSISQYFAVIYSSFYIHFKIPYYWTLRFLMKFAVISKQNFCHIFSLGWLPSGSNWVGGHNNPQWLELFFIYWGPHPHHLGWHSTCSTEDYLLREWTSPCFMVIFPLLFVNITSNFFHWISL